MKNNKEINFIVFAALTLTASFVFAKDLTTAAKSIQDLAQNVGTGIGVTGIVVGGILYALAMPDRGKQVLIGGIIGSAIIHGAVMIQSAITSVVK